MAASDIKAALSDLNDEMLGRAGIEGTAIGRKGDGSPCLKVYVSEVKAGRSAPREVRGFPVVVETSGMFRRL